MQSVMIIPARRASTRLPDKPLADIHGKPMICHVYERALASGAGEVWVATDDAEIAQIVEQHGGKAVMTRADHPSGSDRIWEALQTIDPAKEVETVINVQGDLPTIDPAIITQALQPLAIPEVDMTTLVCPIETQEDRDNPAVVKPVIRWHEGTRTGQALYFTRCPAPYGAEVLYHHIGLYAYRRATLEKFVSLPPSPLEKTEKLEQLRALEYGMRIDVVAVDTVPLGVDTYEQLEEARKQLQ